MNREAQLRTEKTFRPVQAATRCLADPGSRGTRNGLAFLCSRSLRWGAVALIASCVALSPRTPSAAEPIKIGVVHSQGGASAFVAAAKGYFAAEGLDAKLVLFSSAVPIAVAATSGDIDFGSTALTAAFCNLAQQGTLKII